MKKYLSIFLIFFLLFGCSVPVFAAEDSYPVPSLDSTQYDSYIITKLFNTVTCTLYHSDDWDIYFFDEYESWSDRVVLVSSSDSPKVVYQTQQNVNDWDFSSWGTFNQYSHSLSPSYNLYKVSLLTPGQTVEYSTQTIPCATISSDGAITETGEVFFYPIPPLVEATEEALSLFQSQTIQTILTIVLCGVSCLALMIGLSLLHKVLPRFLNR